MSGADVFQYAGSRSVLGDLVGDDDANPQHQERTVRAVIDLLDGFHPRHGASSSVGISPPVTLTASEKR
jgi:hypothetical protein